jgi:hypothetical protein
MAEFDELVFRHLVPMPDAATVASDQAKCDGGQGQLYLEFPLSTITDTNANGIKPAILPSTYLQATAVVTADTINGCNCVLPEGCDGKQTCSVDSATCLTQTDFAKRDQQVCIDDRGNDKKLEYFSNWCESRDKKACLRGAGQCVIADTGKAICDPMPRSDDIPLSMVSTITDASNFVKLSFKVQHTTQCTFSTACNKGDINTDDRFTSCVTKNQAYKATFEEWKVLAQTSPPSKTFMTCGYEPGECFAVISASDGVSLNIVTQLHGAKGALWNNCISPTIVSIQNPLMFSLE